VFVYSHSVSLLCHPIGAESQLCSYKSNTLYDYQTNDISKGMDPLRKNPRGGDNVEVQDLYKSVVGSVGDEVLCSRHHCHQHNATCSLC